MKRTEVHDLPPDLRALVDVLERSFQSEMEDLREEIRRQRRDLRQLQERFSELLLTRLEAAERLSVSERTIMRMEKRGQLERVSGVPGVRYHAAEIERIAEKRGMGSER